ncbi:MAG TPA: hypothetical protein VF589_04130 [Allosphingosinicella sp.]
MKAISAIALAASLAVGAAAIATPAIAQKKQAAASSWTAKLSKAEQAVLAPLEKAVRASDWAAANAALPAAAAAARSADARHFVGQFQYQIGKGTNDKRVEMQGLDAMVASGGGDPADRAALIKEQAAVAQQTGDNAKAARALAEYLKLNPNDQEMVAALASMQARDNPAQAAALVEQQIATAKAAGQKAPEDTYKRALQFAYNGKQGPKSVQLSRELVTAYPTPENWRTALLVYEQNGRLDKAAEMDLLRLMRTTKSLTDKANYFRLANALHEKGLPGEAKAVVDEGLAARVYTADDPSFKALGAQTGPRIAEDRAALPGLEQKAMASGTGTLALNTADAYFGYGDYAKAAGLYRSALQKGSVDANLVNTRLGAALALAGQRAEAEAAFKAVTGARAELAAFWLLWLSQRG